jgi:hypothetical protein
MNVSYAEIEDAAMALDPESKLRLISGLGQSLEPTDIEREWCEEVRRRRDALRQGKASAFSVDDVLAKVIDEIQK